MQVQNPMPKAMKLNPEAFQGITDVVQIYMDQN